MQNSRKRGTLPRAESQKRLNRVKLLRDGPNLSRFDGSKEAPADLHPPGPGGLGRPRPYRKPPANHLPAPGGSSMQRPVEFGKSIAVIFLKHCGQSVDEC